MDVAKQHAATVTATLNAVNAYAEWAPLSDLAKYGIINGYDFVLRSFWRLLFEIIDTYVFLILSLFLMLLNRCGFLLSSPDFRLHACEFFKLVSPR